MKAQRVSHGEVDGQMLHVCGCGYIATEIEVMAVHQVRSHGFPFGTELDELMPEPLHRRWQRLSAAEKSLFYYPKDAITGIDMADPRQPSYTVLQLVKNGQLVDAKFYEADSPSGPWSRIVGEPKKRYVKWEQT